MPNFCRVPAAEPSGEYCWPPCSGAARAVVVSTTSISTPKMDSRKKIPNVEDAYISSNSHGPTARVGQVEPASSRANSSGSEIAPTVVTSHTKTVVANQDAMPRMVSP